MEQKFSNNKLVANSLIVVAVLLGIFFAIMFATKSIFEKPFERKADILDLGEIRYLLNPITFIRDKNLMVFFDEKLGWSVISTHSSVSGCDLSMQDSDLYDPCSRSYFLFNGKPAKGLAKFPLPFFKLYYENYKSPNSEVNISLKHHLLVNTGEIVKPENRFFAPSGSGGSILEAVPKLRELNKLQGIDTAVKIPKILGGRSDEEKGKQFVDLPYIIDYGYEK
ncbi:MAG: hypothetical protein LBE20_04440 [Deltaproteobacteria bacterium]|jgi:hypothetical protein|nr:hypothetical protein [Deltaproteobacteria bacterium]